MFKFTKVDDKFTNKTQLKQEERDREQKVAGNNSPLSFMNKRIDYK